MKFKLYICLFMFFIVQNSYGQGSILKCELSANDTAGYSSSSTSTQFIPDASTPLRKLKVNFHFMLKTNGTGNFTKTDDGYGNSSFTGYDYAKYIVNLINIGKLGNNREMALPPNDPADVIDTKLEFVLDGVHFHPLDAHYYMQTTSASTLMTNYGISETVNIFLMGSNVPGESTIRGAANTSGDYRVTRIRNIWVKYGDAYFQGTGLGGVLHEVGHNLNLLHTMLTNSGDCCDGSPGYCDDGCDDTPTWEYIVNTLLLDDPCNNCWSGEECSNNVMDYNADRVALTPCQLGIIHESLQTTMFNYKVCSHDDDLTICEMSSDNVFAYYGDNVTISGTSCNPQSVTVEDTHTKVVYFDTGVTIYSDFEIELSCEFALIHYDVCN